MAQQILTSQIVKEIGDKFPGKYVCIIVVDEDEFGMAVGGTTKKPCHVPLTLAFSVAAGNVMQTFFNLKEDGPPRTTFGRS